VVAPIRSIINAIRRPQHRPTIEDTVDLVLAANHLRRAQKEEEAPHQEAIGLMSLFVGRLLIMDSEDEAVIVADKKPLEWAATDGSLRASLVFLVLRLLNITPSRNLGFRILKSWINQASSDEAARRGLAKIIGSIEQDAAAREKKALMDCLTSWESDPAMSMCITRLRDQVRHDAHRLSGT
jgi:hypothetical protein